MTGRRFILSLMITPLLAALVLFSAKVFGGEQTWSANASAPIMRFYLFALAAEVFASLPCLAWLRYRGIRLLTASVSGGALAGFSAAVVAPIIAGFSFNSLFLYLIVGALSGVIFWFTAFWKSGYEVQEVD